jgi:hypothetical protein
VRDGRWGLLELVPAWEGNATWDDFLAWSWEAPDGRRLLIAVNYSDHQSQCYVRLPFPDLASVRLRDLLGVASLERDGSELQSRGLYLDLPPWGCHAFALSNV